HNRALHTRSRTPGSSLIPVGLVVGLRDQALFERWLTEAVRWVPDHYEGGPGLAGLKLGHVLRGSAEPHERDVAHGERQHGARAGRSAQAGQRAALVRSSSPPSIRRAVEEVVRGA